MPGELYGRDVLFFSSDAPGGTGGFDLYYATKLSTGVFDSPVNLGSMINTPADEITPFYKDGRLVFASDGLPSFGGLDLILLNGMVPHGLFLSTWVLDIILRLMTWDM